MMTSDKLTALKGRLRSIIVTDIAATLKALKEVLPEGSAKFSVVLNLEGQLNAANLKKIRGVVSAEALTLMYNQIRSALIELVSGLEATDFDPAPTGIQIPPDKTGSILYKIPDSMRLEEESKCVVRLAFEEESIIRNIEITAHTELRSIRISEVMDVNLLDPNPEPTFAIRTLTAGEQFVERGDYTEWIFFVKPLSEGSYPLMLKVSVVEVVMGKERKKEIVLEEIIQVVTASGQSDADSTEFKASGYAFSPESVAFDQDSEAAPARQIAPPPFTKAAAPKKSRNALLRQLSIAAVFLLVGTLAINLFINVGAGNEPFPADDAYPDLQEDASSIRPGTETEGAGAGQINTRYEVYVLVGQDLQQAELRVDGELIQPISNDSSRVTLTVAIKATPTRFELLKEGQRLCWSEEQITKDGQQVHLQCLEE